MAFAYLILHSPNLEDWMYNMLCFSSGFVIKGKNEILGNNNQLGLLMRLDYWSIISSVIQDLDIFISFGNSAPYTYFKKYFL